MSARQEIEKKISEYAAKLEILDGPEDKRVKKRVLQALGKLKKQLASLDSTSAGRKSAEGVEDGEEDITESIDEVANPKPVDVVLSRKHLKAKLKLLNRELADYAQKKQLKTAVKRFSWGVRKGMEPDKHTYANLINCYVRCGDLEGALKQFDMMNEANIEPNIVIYTTLLKGYCDKGDLEGAQNVLFVQIPNHKLSPGIRTVNTFIRGCTKIGAVTSGMRAHQMLLDSVKVSLENNSKNSGKKRKRSSNTKTNESDDDEDDNDDDDDDDLINKDIQTGNLLQDGNMDDNDNDGRASLFESLVALLCQSFQLDKAALLAVDAVTSLEITKSKFKIDIKDIMN